MLRRRRKTCASSLVCYTTDVAAYRAISDSLRGRLREAGCKPAFVLLDELEATAVA